MLFRVIIIVYLISFQQIAAASITENISTRLERYLIEIGIGQVFLDLREASNGRKLVTDLDQFRELFLFFRHLSLERAYVNKDYIYRNNLERGKMQPIVPSNISFPCNLTNARSPQPPISVHRLRPGDIDVIACFGDSLSAGNGILSTGIFNLLDEHRGFVFSGGGLGNWRNVLTLPNILKVFNPKLYGYSTAVGLTVDRASHLNIAEPMLMSRDLPHQAKVFISRLRMDPNVDMINHWKLLTIYVGSNDICSDSCHQSIENFLRMHEQDLYSTLTILRNSVPRLLVNLLPPPDIITTIRKMRNIPISCQIIRIAFCHCVFSLKYNDTYLKTVSEYTRQWEIIDRRIAALPEFQTDNFAVIYQPFMRNPTLPTLPSGDVDLRYFSSDCFHFSQLGQATLSNALWNSMMQPYGQKQIVLEPPYKHFICPSEEHPYIATLRNS